MKRPAEQHRNLFQVADSLPMMTWVCGADGRLAWLNKGWLKFTGHRLEAALEGGWEAVVHSDDVDHRANAQRLALEARDSFEIEYRLRRSDGTYRWVLDRGTPQFSNVSRFVGYLGMVMDVTERKIADQKLRWLLQAVEQCPASVVITDLKGNIEYVNPKFTAVTGYSFEEAIGQNPRILKSGEMAPHNYQKMWDAITNGEWRGEFHNKRKNGELYWESASIAPIRSDAGRPTHYLAVKEDITERKRVEASFRSSEERFRIAMENAQIAVYDVDPATGKAEVRGLDNILRSLTTFEDWASAIHPQDRERMLAAHQRRCETGMGLHETYRMVLPDGVIRYLSDHGAPDRDGHWVGVIRDITEEMQAEESKARLAAIVECSNDAIFSLDELGTVRTWNAAAERLYGYARMEILGQHAAVLSAPRSCDAAKRRIRWALSGALLSSYETEHQRKDGTVFPVCISAAPIRDRNGKALGCSVTVRDISERKQAKMALKESEQRYRHLVEDASDTIFTIDLDGNIRTVNGEGRIPGYAQQELLSMNLLQITVPEHQQIILEWIQQRQRDPNAGHLETELVARDGRRTAVEISSRLQVREGVAEGILCIARDISQRKRIEQLAQNRLEVLEMVVRNHSLNSVLRRMEAMIENYCAGVTVRILVSDTSRRSPGPACRLRIPIQGCDGSRLGFIEINHPEGWNPSDSDRVFLDSKARLAAIALEHRRIANRLAYQAQHDALTDLPNRTLLEDRLKRAISLARRQATMVAVIYVDLDRFKFINDTLGHDVGDVLLKEVAKRLSIALRESDTLARAGGDEFIAVLFGIETTRDAELACDRIIHAIRQPFQVMGHELFITASVGVSMFPRDGEDATTLQKHADVAMYEAKKRGSNRYQSFTRAMNAASLERLQIENQLHRAVERGELMLHYQPQFRGGRLAGVEALVRWNHPKLGLIAPNQFVPIAEESGLIIPISIWILGEACRQHQSWRRAGHPPLAVAVNISAIQFTHTNLASHVQEILSTHHMQPRYLELELTEGVLMRDIEDSIRQIAELRDLGVRISIDDFGTGYSSLSYLQRLPIDDLKIDRSFIEGLDLSADKQALVQAIIGLAHGLKMTATAEGVGTEGELAILDALGCDRMQGFFLGEPVPPSQLEALLRDTEACPVSSDKTISDLSRSLVPLLPGGRRISPN
ncbi:MAG: PAS domain S-box protein [Bryobacteraceae bacterium]